MPVLNISLNEDPTTTEFGSLSSSYESLYLIQIFAFQISKLSSSHDNFQTS